jgi:hypothetical protein
MTAAQIENRIESEPLNIHNQSYSSAREILREMLGHELENGDAIAFAREYMASQRRAMLHELQAVGAPDEVIAAILA